MDYVADDFKAINDKLVAEAAQRKTDENIDLAVGLALDMHGHRAGLSRSAAETDVIFRTRIKAIS